MGVRASGEVKGNREMLWVKNPVESTSGINLRGARISALTVSPIVLGVSLRLVPLKATCAL